MNQVVEHVRDVNQWISKAWNLLKPGGILAIALPNFDSLFHYVLGANDPYIIPPEHLNYFNGRNLRLAVSNHGLGVKKIEWTSKLTPATIDRLPLNKIGKPVLTPLVGMSLKTIDLLLLGIFVTVYAGKD